MKQSYQKNKIELCMNIYKHKINDLHVKCEEYFWIRIVVKS